MDVLKLKVISNLHFFRLTRDTICQYLENFIIWHSLTRWQISDIGTFTVHIVHILAPTFYQSSHIGGNISCEKHLLTCARMPESESACM